jgi:hypothetical protein
MKFMRIFLITLALFLVSAEATAEPEKVIVGAHVNDIQAIDLQNHNYRLDLYVWFRWKNPVLEPWKTAEFMNAYDPADHVRTPLYDAPLKMPDGSYYMIIRDQGKFSVKFPLQKYPFDRQNLAVIMEDSLHDINELIYVTDTEIPPISLSAGISLPGFDVKAPQARAGNFLYATTFGDISQKTASTYSRASFEVPVTRPKLSSAVKIFLPIMLIIVCTGLILFVHPVYIEGRLGVAITTLLTLVALQLTTTSALPDVDYLMLTDKIYLLSYSFIIATLMQVVLMSRAVHEKKYDSVITRDKRALGFFCLAFALGVAAILAL